MHRSLMFVLPAILFGLRLAMTAPAIAQELRDNPNVQDRDESWYRELPSGYDPNPQVIVQQKAMERAQQRSQRLASLNWYGMYNARPTAASTPFTSRYSPVWENPGGRPFAWNPGQPQLWQGYVR